MITSVDALNFRAFQGKSIKIGQRVTIIGGRNATGKSTLLAMIGNACKLGYSKMKPLVTKNFTAEFSEILKGSFDFDKTGYGTVYKVNFDEYDETKKDYRNFRISWTDNNTRFRVIPGYTYIDEHGNEKASAAKKDFPCIYIGLSRLYPVGESENDLQGLPLDLGVDKTWYIENYKKILLIKDDVLSVNRVIMSDTSTKKGVGINTASYDYITNSAGQDNVGQILLAVLSFKRLKEADELKYSGGILLIDEIEATLHNHAQLKLVELLDKASKDLSLQIVFTTHSETILKRYSRMVEHNGLSSNPYELHYLHNSNGTLDVLTNPNYNKIVYDLNVTDITRSDNRLQIYSEDAETRWFAEKLLKKHSMNFNLINTEMGCSNLMQLDSKDPGNFSKILFIFDGDVKEEDFKKYPSPNRFNKVILPGKKSPEDLLYSYLIALKPDHALWSTFSSYGITLDSLKENGPYSDVYEGIQREKNKKWFRNYRIIFEECNIVDYWIIDNEKEYRDFNSKFIKAYNSVASLTFKPLLQL